MKRRNTWLAIFLALTLAVPASLTGCGRRQKQSDESSSSKSSSVHEEPDERREPDQDDEDSEDEDDPDRRDDEDDEDNEDSGGSREDKVDEEGGRGSGNEQRPSSGGNGTTGAGSKADSFSSSQAPPANQTTPRPSAPSSKADSEASSKDVSSSSKGSSKAPSGSSSKKDYEAQADDVTYRDAGAYSTKATYQNGVIRGDGITLRNKTFEGDLTITSAAGDGDISLENVTVKGKLSIAGCGGWVKLYDTDIGSLELDKKGAQVFASQGTDVRSVAVKKDATLQEGTLSGRSDGFENITVAGPTNTRTDLDLQGIEVDRVTTETQSWITVDGDSSIERLYAEAPTYVRGSGEVGQLTASNDYVYYQSRPERVSTDSGVRSPRKYDSKNNYWKGGDRKDEDDERNGAVTNRKEIYIRWVDAVNNVSLTDGQTKTIHLETNAKTLKASSSNDHVLGVTVDEDQNLVLKARGAGNVKITVTGSRSGYTSDTRTFWVTVESAASQKPVIGDPGFSPAGWTNADVSVSFTVTDDNLESVTVPQRTVQKLSGDRYQFSAPANGTYTITARDKSGNSVTRDAVVKNIDKTAPQMKLISNPPLSGSPVLVSFEVNDAGGSGFKWESLRVSGIDPKAVSRTGSVCSFSASAAGTYTVTGQDNAGNAFRQEITVSSTQVDDSVAITGTAVTPSGWAKSKTVSISVQSALPSTLTVLYGTENIPVTGPSFTAVKNGAYTVTASNGRKSASTTVNVSGIDMTQPNLKAEWTFHPADKARRFLVITASDNESGLGQVFVNGVPVKNFTNPYYYEVETASRNFTITARDMVGNETSALTISVPALTPQETDKTAPEVTITFPEGWAKEKTVDITVSDSESGVREASVHVDGVPVQTQSVLRDSNQQRFTYTVQKDSVVSVSATDGAGNSVTKEVSIDKIDTIPPVINAVVSDADKWKQKKTLTVSATDQGGSNLVSLTVNDENVNSSFSREYTANTPITIVAVDSAGNRTEQKVTIGMIDTTAPASPTLQYTTNVTGQVVLTVLNAYAAANPATVYSFETSKTLTLLPPPAEANGSPETTVYRTEVVPTAAGTPVAYGAPVAAAVPLTLTAQNGADTPYSIQVQTTDGAGNVTTTEYRVTITVPKPAVPTTPTTPGTTTPDPVTPSNPDTTPTDPVTPAEPDTTPIDPPAPADPDASATNPPAEEHTPGGTENKSEAPSPAPEDTGTENQQPS